MKYKEIAIILRNEIINEQIDEGDQIPPEDELCKRFDCSKITIKKALSILIDEGLVYRLRGSGTFVKKNAVFHSKYKNHIQKVLADENLEDGYTRKVVNFGTRLPSISVANHMGLDHTKDYIYFFNIVHYKNGVPFQYEKSYVPIKHVSGLSTEILEESFYKFVNNTTKINVASVHKNINIVTSPDDLASELQINEKDQVILSEEMRYLSNGEIFEYSLFYIRNDSFHMFIVVNDGL